MVAGCSSFFPAASCRAHIALDQFPDLIDIVQELWGAFDGKLAGSLEGDGDTGFYAAGARTKDDDLIGEKNGFINLVSNEP